MAMDTSSLYFGLLADQRRRAERESALQAQAAGQMAQYQQDQMQKEDRALEHETKRAELSAKYSELSGQPVQQEYSQAQPVQQAAEVGRLQGAAFGPMNEMRGSKAWDRSALSRQNYEQNLNRDRIKQDYAIDLQNMRNKTDKADMTLKWAKLHNSSLATLMESHIDTMRSLQDDATILGTMTPQARQQYDASLQEVQGLQLQLEQEIRGKQQQRPGNALTPTSTPTLAPTQYKEKDIWGD